MDVINLNTIVTTAKLKYLLTEYFSENVRILTANESNIRKHSAFDEIKELSKDELDTLAMKTAFDLMNNYSYAAIENTIAIILSQDIGFNMLLVQYLAHSKASTKPHQVELNAWVLLHNTSDDTFIEVKLIK